MRGRKRATRHEMAHIYKNINFVCQKVSKAAFFKRILLIYWAENRM